MSVPTSPDFYMPLTKCSQCQATQIVQSHFMGLRVACSACGREYRAVEWRRRQRSQPVVSPHVLLKSVSLVGALILFVGAVTGLLIWLVRAPAPMQRAQQAVADAVTTIDQAVIPQSAPEQVDQREFARQLWSSYQNVYVKQYDMSNDIRTKAADDTLRAEYSKLIGTRINWKRQIAISGRDDEKKVSVAVVPIAYVFGPPRNSLGESDGIPDANLILCDRHWSTDEESNRVVQSIVRLRLNALFGKSRIVISIDKSQWMARHDTTKDFVRVQGRVVDVRAFPDAVATHFLVVLGDIRIMPWSE